MGPYGNKLASSGSMGTAKGYTGQYQDPMGLDYYNARYYDPVIGCFISADTVQGNAQGMDPYSYVNGNPETLTDPTGQVTHCHEPGDCGPGSYTTNVSGGATGPVQSICLYSCYVGSGGSNDSGGCASSCDDGVYRLPPQLNSSRPTSGGNPKIETSTPPAVTPPVKPPPSPIKSWSHLILGIGKIVFGIGVLVLAFTSYTNPVMALLQFLARMAFKGALSTVMSLINDGLRNVISSVNGVSQGTKIVVDLFAVVLDLVGIFATLQSVSEAVKLGGLLKDVAFSVEKAAAQAVKFYKGEITLAVVNNISRARNLATAFPNTLLGTGQLATDFTDLGVDAGWWQ